MAQTIKMLMYSAKKNKANFIPEYSVWNPAVNSDSASDKSNGARLVSAVTAIINITNEIVGEYKKNYFNWESVDKPLKAMSSYKSEELTELCKKLDLDFSEKKTKKEMYELLIMNL